MAVTKRKTAAKSASAKKSYVSRPSQVTKKKPTKRLTERRAKNLKAPKGVFPNPMTTAKMREKARLYESKGEWEKAAQCWADAIKLYPFGGGELKARDINSMMSRMKNALYTADQLKNNPAEIHIDVDSHNAKGSKSRTKTNPIKRGVISRPSKASRRAVYLVESSKAKNGPWESQGIFPTEEKARNYAEALHESNLGYWFRVVLK